MASLSQGVILGLDGGVGLSARDCFVIGRVGYENGNLDHARAWMGQALRKLLEEGEEGIDRTDILEYTLKYPLTVNSTVMGGNSDENDNDDDVYKELCRGEETLSKKQRAQLSCKYLNGAHPFLLIAPVKEEELFLSPRIVMYCGH